METDLLPDLPHGPSRASREVDIREEYRNRDVKKSVPDKFVEGDI